MAKWLKVIYFLSKLLSHAVDKASILTDAILILGYFWDDLIDEVENQGDFRWLNNMYVSVQYQGVRGIYVGQLRPYRDLSLILWFTSSSPIFLKKEEKKRKKRTFLYH